MEKFLFEQTFITPELAELLKATVLWMPNWKWIVLATAITSGFLLKPILQFLLKELKVRNPIIKKYPHSFWGYFLKANTERPTAWILIILFWFFVADAIVLPERLGTYYDHLLRGIIAISIIRLIYFAVDAACSVLADMTTKTKSAYNSQLVPFASKTLKVLVVVLGFLIVLQSFGLNVVSLLAGLGLGGLALALAAQDTAANLFGSITILLDSPFKVGDQIKIKDMEGTVEEVGFRSTRIRTFYNSVISIPNSMMAKETVDNLGERTARRSRQILGITYETPPEQIHHFCERLRYMISKHDKVRKDSVTIAFNNFNASSLDILVQFHLTTPTAAEELATQQEIFVEILNVAAEMNIDFAYPTQTVYEAKNTESALAAMKGNA